VPPSLYRVSISAEEPQKRRLSQTWVREVVRRALSQEAVPSGRRVEVLLAGDETVRRLNAAYRSEDSVTDVLSFPTDAEDGDFFPGAGEEGWRDVGQIALSLPQAARQALEAGHSFEEECAHLLVHGVLHLLGYDHEQPDEEAAMRAREDAALAALTGRPGRHYYDADHGRHVTHPAGSARGAR
jgi:probable rRNA maturation factor